jgi:hypothetical protein
VDDVEARGNKGILFVRMFGIGYIGAKANEKYGIDILDAERGTRGISC